MTTTTTTASTTTRSVFVVQRHMVSAIAAVEEGSSENDFGTAMPPQKNVYEELGIEEGKLALGVQPEEVLNYLGT